MYSYMHRLDSQGHVRHRDFVWKSDGGISQREYYRNVTNKIFKSTKFKAKHQREYFFRMLC